MEAVRLLNSRSSVLPISSTFLPSTISSPEVGSISLFTCRISVDLPDPESPIITCIPLAGISIFTSFSAKTESNFSSSSFLEIPFWTWLIMPAGFLPKILYRFLIATLISDSMLAFQVFLQTLAK